MKTTYWKWKAGSRIQGGGFCPPFEPGERVKENSGESGICLSGVKRSELCRDLNFTNE